MISHESFPGLEWSAAECDELAARFVPVQLLANEADLFQIKHWDYRFLHPVQATQLFAHEYAKAKKHAVERRTDIWVGRNMRGIKDDCIFMLPARSITGFWKGRQMADALGIPYDFYCEHAMLFADVARWENLPTPIQLYSENVPEHLRTTDFAVSMVTFIANKWFDRQANMITFAKHEAYLAENYCGSPAQAAYVNHLVERIQSSNHRAAALASAIEKGQMSCDMVLQAWPKSGESLYRQAERLTC